MNVRNITHDGVTRSLKGWSEHTAIPIGTIAARIRAGWDLSRVFSERPNRKFTKGGRPPSMSVRPVPSLLDHRATGRAYSRWHALGKRHVRYFGPWGSDAARKAYCQFAAEWIAGASIITGDQKRLEVSVAAVISAWLDHCARTYRKKGKPTSEVSCCLAAVKPLNELYGHTSAVEFDGRRLQAVREAMVGCAWKRKTINDHCARICRMFSWAAGEKMVPAETAAGIERVEPLVAGRREDVAESAPVTPAPAEHVEIVLRSDALDRLPARRELLASMIRLQLLTGMRPGELCALSGADVDRQREPWTYRVREHKSLHKDKTRTVFFGPRSRALLAPLLDAAGAGAVFMLAPSRAKGKPRQVSVQFYGRAIGAACKAAGIETWTPNQLRHSKATAIMNAVEDDAVVAALLGNTPEVARQVYAHRAGESVARRIAEVTG